MVIDLSLLASSSRASLRLCWVGGVLGLTQTQLARAETCTPTFPVSSSADTTPRPWSMTAESDVKIEILLSETPEEASLDDGSLIVWTRRTGRVFGRWDYAEGRLTFTADGAGWLPGDQVVVQAGRSFMLASGDEACPWTTTFLVAGDDGDGTLFLAAQSVENVGTEPRDIITADLDNDGWLDLVVPSGDGTLHLVFNQGCALRPIGWENATEFCVTWSARRKTINLRDPETGEALIAYAVQAVDVDMDGSVDLVVPGKIVATGEDGTRLLLLRNNGLGDFETVAAYDVPAGPRNVDSADLNGDGAIDLVVVSEDAYTVSVLLGDPARPGEFVPSVTDPIEIGYAPRDVRLIDLDGDGVLDALVTQLEDGPDEPAPQGWIHRLMNDGSGALQGSGSGAEGGGVVELPAANGVPCWAYDLDIADLDQDGQPEVVLPAHNCGDVLLYDLVNPPTSMGLRGGAKLWGPALGDVDKDGLGEILAVASSAGMRVYLVRLKNGVWVEDTSLSFGIAASRGVVLADFDRNGTLDAAVISDVEWGEIAFVANAIDVDQDGFSAKDGDCDDLRPEVYPGAPEEIPGDDAHSYGIDNNCDGATDEGTRWSDDDGDTFTEDGIPSDCDDDDDQSNPAALEILDGADNDCDGVVDELAYATACLCTSAGPPGPWALVVLGLVLLVRRRRVVIPSALVALLCAGEASAGRRVAVVVGVSEYSADFSDLRWAGRDAEALGAVLEDEGYGGFDRVIVLQSGGAMEPTRANILTIVQEEGADLRPDDLLLFYFSGHALLRPSEDGAAQHWLVPEGATMQNLSLAGINVEELSEIMDSFSAERRVLIIDGCYTTRTTGGVQTKGELQSEDMQRGWYSVRMLAAGEGFNAIEDPSLGHSVYTYYLLEALQNPTGIADADGSGGVTAFEAHQYATPRTVARTGQRQEPALELRSGGSPDMVLSGSEALVPNRSSLGTWTPYVYKGANISATPAGGDGAEVMAPVALGLSLPPSRYYLELRDSAGERLAGIHVTLEPGLTRIEDLFAPPLREQLLLSLGAGLGGVVPLVETGAGDLLAGSSAEEGTAGVVDQRAPSVLPELAPSLQLGLSRFTGRRVGGRAALGVRMASPPAAEALNEPPRSTTVDVSVAPVYTAGRWKTAATLGPSLNLALLAGGYQPQVGTVIGPGVHADVWRVWGESRFVFVGADAWVFKMGAQDDSQSTQLSWSVQAGVSRVERR